MTKLDVEPEPDAPPDPAAAFRAAVEKRHSQLGAVLEDALIRVDGRAVTIALDPPNPTTERRLGEPQMKKVLDEAAREVFGRTASVAVESLAPSGGDLTAAAAEADPEALERENLRRRVENDDRVKKVLDLFDGEVASVRPDKG